MSKTKPSGQIHYEILFIIPNKFTDDEAQGIFKKVGELIKDLGGNLSLENYWGKKKFAYPIKHENYGYYGLYEFDINRSAITEINNKLRLDTDILRFLIVKKDLKNEEQIKKDERIKAKIAEKKIEEKKSEEEEKEEKKKKSQKTTKSEDKKVNLKSLDEKLEDVLNIDNLL